MASRDLAEDRRRTSGLRGRDRRLDVGRPDAYGDPAIVWAVPVAGLCGVRVERRYREEGSEQIRLQIRSLPYHSRRPGVTDPMEH
jgi:hypothetical protein